MPDHPELSRRLLRANRLAGGVLLVAMVAVAGWWLWSVAPTVIDDQPVVALVVPVVAAALSLVGVRCLRRPSTVALGWCAVVCLLLALGALILAVGAIASPWLRLDNGWVLAHFVVVCAFGAVLLIAGAVGAAVASRG